MSDVTKIKKAFIAGAEYYGVTYPTGVTVCAEGGSNIVYDHMNRIITSNSDKKAIDSIINRAKIKAQKEMES